MGTQPVKFRQNNSRALQEWPNPPTTSNQLPGPRSHMLKIEILQTSCGRTENKRLTRRRASRGLGFVYSESTFACLGRTYIPSHRLTHSFLSTHPTFLSVPFFRSVVLQNREPRCGAQHCRRVPLGHRSGIQALAPLFGPGGQPAVAPCSAG